MKQTVIGLVESVNTSLGYCCKRVIELEMQLFNVTLPFETEVVDDTVSIGGLVWNKKHFIFSE